MEELGEVSDAMVRMYSYRTDNFVKGEPRQRQLRLESQIADVFARLFSLVGAIGIHKRELTDFEKWLGSTVGEEEPVLLSRIIWKRYGSDVLQSFYCPFCEQANCSCPLVFVPATHPLNELKALL
jgi:hypothetical protein